MITHNTACVCGCCSQSMQTHADTHALLNELPLNLNH